MRNIIINKIGELMKDDKNIYLLTADLGYGVLDNTLKKYPKQCINVGIAEQNMIGIAAGLALSGKKVFCYSIVPFVTMRCYEQIRIDICTHNLDVTLIGVGGGFAYGTLGNTHYGIEDINIMRGLPNMKIFSPADKIEMEIGFKLLLKEKTPTYIRLNRGGEENIHKISELKEENILNGIKISNGKKLIIFTTGQITGIVKEVIEDLKQQNILIKLISISFLKPINSNAILDNIAGYNKVITIEEHNIIGGLGSSLAEIISENGTNIKLKRLGINDRFFYKAGSQYFMRELAGLDKKTIINEIKLFINK